MRIRRRLAAGISAVLLVSVTAAGVASASHAPKRHHPARRGDTTPLPVAAMEAALHAKGTIIQGDLSVGIERTDINNVKIGNVPIKPSFEINGELDFQPLDGGKRAFLNGDLALEPTEINGVINALISNGLAFQAEHQHMYDFQPMVWFIHMRGTGAPVKLARALYNVLKATSTPLPQAPPAHPKTPLDKERLQHILHGYDAEVGDNGVVTVYVSRRNPVYIDKILVRPATNIATNIAFEPLNQTGSRTAVVPDFGMVAGEINAVVGTMRSMHWDIGCLYNQETAESPQLFFSHMFKVGNPYALAAEIRRGLDRTNSH